MPAGVRTVIFTGLSGSGKTTALRAVEDLGYYCVDNLPLPLLEPFIDTMAGERRAERAALVVDVRAGKDIEGYATASATLRARGAVVELVFLDARDDVLVRRFSQTRRRHPLSSRDLPAAIAEERRLLAPLEENASLRLDTSDLTVHELRQVIQDRYRAGGDGLAVSLLSFGFRHGLPAHADLVLDVRFLPNPFFVDALRPLSGRDRDVAAYVLGAADAAAFVERAESLLAFLLPRYEAEGKVYLTVAIGCTGGRHRSVAIAEALGARLGAARPVTVRHRDIDR